MKPMSTDSFKMDVYVDSDFLGLYGQESRVDPDNVKSRIGHVNDNHMLSQEEGGLENKKGRHQIASKQTDHTLPT